VLSKKDEARERMVSTIETVIAIQLKEFREELTESQRKLIAYQCAREAARRLASATSDNQ
jgi:hypothetical protein